MSRASIVLADGQSYTIAQLRKKKVWAVLKDRNWVEIVPCQIAEKRNLYYADRSTPPQIEVRVVFDFTGIDVPKVLLRRIDLCQQWVAPKDLHTTQSTALQEFDEFLATQETTFLHLLTRVRDQRARIRSKLKEAGS